MQLSLVVVCKISLATTTTNGRHTTDGRDQTSAAAARSLGQPEKAISLLDGRPSENIFTTNLYIFSLGFVRKSLVESVKMVRPSNRQDGVEDAMQVESWPKR